MILESLKNNEDRKEVGRWIVATINEGHFDRDAMNIFMKKFKKKFEVPGWRKCVQLFNQIQGFQKRGPMKYLERWLELEAKIQNCGVFLAVHSIEKAGMADTTTQS